jgi:nitrogen fixation NifU-like protein
MTALTDLYQEVILDHNKTPRNFRTVEGATHSGLGHNPLCGDQLALYVKVEGGVIREIGFQGKGCAISKASASLMTDSVKGRTVAEATALFEAFHAMVMAEAGTPADEARLGKLAVLAGVAEFPTRVKCATLAWHTLQAALQEPGGHASTENETEQP